MHGAVLEKSAPINSVTIDTRKSCITPSSEYMDTKLLFSYTPEILLLSMCGRVRVGLLQHKASPGFTNIIQIVQLK